MEIKARTLKAFAKIITSLVLLFTASVPAHAQAIFPCALNSSHISGLTVTNPGDGTSFVLSGVLTGANISASDACGDILPTSTIRILGHDFVNFGTTVANITGQGGDLVRVAADEIQYRPPSAAFSGTDTFTIHANSAARLINVTVTVLPAGDTTAPAAPIITAPADGSTTSDTTPVFEGTAEAGSTVTVLIDGNPAGSTAAVGEDWTFIPGTALAPGPHSVTATATDAANNISELSAPNSFTIAAPPTVTNVTANRGSTLGGGTLSLTGTNFTNATDVSFGGAAASFLVISSTSIAVHALPPHAAGVVNVIVTTPTGTSAAATANEFTYIAPPTVSGISPAAGPPGGGTTVTVTGTDFLNANRVSFGAINATYVVNSATQITATSPAGATGTIDITVRTVGGTSATSAADQFTYVVAPTVTAISPASGPGTGGTTLTISGTNLSDATAVTFGATAAAGFTVNSASSITATSPAGSGIVNVSVTNPGGTSATSTGDHFTYVAAPTTANVSAAVSYGSSDNPIVLSLGGGAATSVAVATQAINGIATATGMSISYTPNAGHSGSDSFTYTATGDGGTSTPATITITVDLPPGPTVTSLSASLGSTLGGGTVTLLGSNFTDATDVSFGGVSAGFIFIGDGNIVVPSLPAHAAGVVNVVVTTPGGTSAATAANIFTYIAPPTVDAVSPGIGGPAGGTNVILTGTHFTGATNVRFGAVTASFFVNSATQITATSPAGSVGSVNITVRTVGGTSSSGAGNQFTYVGAPTVAGRTANTPYQTAVPIDLGSAITGISTSIAVASPPTHGPISIAGNIMTYTPAAGYAGPDSFTYTATGPGGTSAPATVPITIGAPTITVAPTSLTAPAYAVPYNASISTSGGQAPYSFAFTGSLPPGLTPNSDGTLSGTPTATGTFNFTITATDSSTGPAAPFAGSQAYSFTIGAPTLALIPPAGGLAGTVAGAAYSQTLSASGGVAPYSFSIAPGTLPAGLTLAPDGMLSGTPTETGNFGFTVTVTDSGAALTASAAYTLAVSAPTVILASGTLTAPVYNAPYNATLTASGGTAPYSFAVAPGGLPTGLMLAVDGTLSGTPLAVGNFSFTVTATDSTGGTGPFTGTQTYSFAIAAPTLTLVPPAGGLPTAIAGAAYTKALTANGGTAPYGFAITAGAAPAGLALSPTGTLSGTPTAGGNFSFTVTATDSGAGGPFTASAAYTLIVATAAVTIAPTNLPAAMMEAAYSQALAASGGTAPYSYAVSDGALPGGLTLSPAGVLAGAPSVHGSFAFTVTATDSSAGTGPYSGGQGYTLTVSPPLAPVANAVSANVGYGSSANAIAPGLTGGTATSIALITPPAHGTASISGLAISYTPTPGYAGQDSFTYGAANEGGTSAPATVTIAVGDPVVAVGPAGLAAGQQDVAYSATLTASGGTAPYAFALTAGALPAGLTLAANGTLSGTPSANGNFAFTATATDASTGAGPFSASIAYTLQIALPAAPVARDAPGTVVGGAASVTIDLAALVGGHYSDIRIDTQPAHGTVTIASGFIATYRPAAGYQGADAFTFVAIGPGGTSAPAHAAITVGGAAPVASSLNATLLNGRELTLDITTDAAEGPFTNAAIVSITPVNALTAELIAGGTPANRSYGLKLRAIGRFSGSAVVRYTLSNAFGTSQPATVTVTVEARPDPAADPTVRALSAAQAEATRRFASTQLGNFARRNEQLHGSGAGSRGRQIGIRISGGDLAMDERRGDDSVDEGGPDGRNAPARSVDMRALRGVQVADASLGASPVLAQMATTESDAAPGGERLPGSIEMWTGGALQIGTRDATTRRAKLKISSSGLSAGFDLKATDALTLGIGGGYGFDRTKVGEKDAGRLDAENWVGAIYGSLTPVDGMFIDGVFGIGGLDFDTRRLAPGGGVALGRRSGSMAFGSLATGIDRTTKSWTFSGYGRVEYMSARLKAYSETGADIYNLAFAERKPESFATILGARGATAVPSSIGLFTPRGRVEWRHDFNRSGAQALDYADIAGAGRIGHGYLIRDDNWLRDEYQIEIGTGLEISGGWAFGVDVGGRFGSGTTMGTAKVSASTKF